MINDLMVDKAKEKQSHTSGNTQEQLLRNLIQYTKSQDPNLRIAAYTALGRIPRKEAVDCLLKGMEDPVPQVQKAAGEALEMVVEFCCVYGYQKAGRRHF